MHAMNRATGAVVATEVEEVEQGIDEVLSTLPGERVMRADYGSPVFRLADVPQNQSGAALISQATGDALRRHEPRFKLGRVILSATAGEFVADVQGTIVQTAAPILTRRADE